jgi:1,4-dihydroxy-2-naphthoate octaprenyltransferase
MNTLPKSKRYRITAYISWYIGLVGIYATLTRQTELAVACVGFIGFGLMGYLYSETRRKSEEN